MLLSWLSRRNRKQRRSDAADLPVRLYFVPIRHNRFVALARLIFGAYLQKSAGKKHKIYRLTKKRRPLLTISPCLAYNIYRQKIEMSIGHSESPRRSELRGLSFPFWVGGLGPRLATS